MTADIDLAFRRFDGLNRLDPRQVTHEGRAYPRELLHAIKVHEWVLRLNPAASRALQLASRCNAICRWEIPRDSYPRTTAGYHAWRKALQVFHSEKASEILKEEGFEPADNARVSALIRMEGFPADPDAQTLEDADCLTFLETKFHEYLGGWDEPKTIRILKGTIRKMSPAARAIAMDLPLPPEARALIQKASSC